MRACVVPAPRNAPARDRVRGTFGSARAQGPLASLGSARAQGPRASLAPATSPAPALAASAPPRKRRAVGELTAACGPVVVVADADADMNLIDVLSASADGNMLVETVHDHEEGDSDH